MKLVSIPISRQRLGSIVILLSAASFGAVTPFSQFAYNAGVNTTTILVVRYFLAGIVVFGYVLIRRLQWRMDGQKLGLTVGLALLLGLMSFAYLNSTYYIPVAFSALIYYSYPVLVTILTIITGNLKLLKMDRIGHMLGVGGQLLSLGGLVLLLKVSGGGISIIGIGLAFFSAISFAFIMVFGGRLMRAIHPMILNLYVALINMFAFSLVAVFRSGFSFPDGSLGWAGLGGTSIAFVMGFLGLFVGIQMLGPSRAACLTNIEPLVTIGLAVWLLGESFSLWQVIGSGIVLVGIGIMCFYSISDGKEIVRVWTDTLKGAERLPNCTPACWTGSKCLLVDN